jgi:general secretion pathway protein D
VKRPSLLAGLALAALPLLAACASSRLYQQGMTEFDRGQYEVALQKLSQAAERDPRNLTYRIDYKSRRDEAVQKLVAEGDRARSSGDGAAAESSYKRVLAIEPGNSRAARGIEGVAADRRHTSVVAQALAEFNKADYDQADARLAAVLAEDPGFAAATALRARIEAAKGPVTVTPRLKTRDNRPVTLQFRDAPTKMVFEVLSRQTGINFIFDKDVKSDGKTTIFVQDVPIEQAIDLVLGQNQLARQVLSENLVLLYPNTPAKQKDYQDQIVKTFYLNAASPKDIESLLKTVLDIKTLVVNERANSVTVRETPEVVRMAEKLVASVDLSEPEVMLEVEVLEISRSKLQQLGISYPGSVTVSTPKSLVLNDLNGGSGSAINGNSISVSPLSLTVDALKTTSNANVLASPRIRARNHEKAKVLIGSRVPVITTAASASGNGGVISNTNVQYLDVGLTLDVEPTIYTDGDVAIKISLEVSSITNKLTVPTGNGGSTIAYEIGTRNATTLLQLKDGETQVLAGLIRDSDTRSASKIPGLGDVPLLGRLFSDHGTDRAKTEVVLSITPRVIRAKQRPSSDTSEFWFGTESRSGLAPLAAGGIAAARTTATQPAAPAPAASGAGVNVSTLSSPATVVGAAGGSPGGAGVVNPAAMQSVPSALPPGAAAPGATVAAAAQRAAVPAAAEGAVPHAVTTLVGPSNADVGDEFAVTLQMQTDVPIARARLQVRFDGAALQLVGGDPGGLVPQSAGAKVVGRGGGAQLDITTDPGEAMAGSGDVLVLRFKALQPREQTAIAAQMSVLTPSGGGLASSTPTPLTLSIGN